MKKYILILLICIVSISTYSQSYTVEGLVLNTSNYPVEAVSCTLQNFGNSEMRKTELTTASGKFLFKDIAQGKYILTLLHMSYEKEVIEVEINSNTVLDPFVLIFASSELSEITVTAERPVVKAVSGKLVYNVPLLVQQRVVTNAFDALKAVPNILSSGDNDLQLAGANEFSILINGQPTNMNMEQLQNMLKSMPADRIADIEVMYSTPPQYNVKGASINIVLADKKRRSS